MTSGRPGFTLVETVLALAIAGMVSTLAFASLSAGLDTEQRVRRVSAAADDEARWRALSGDALRHITDATQPGRPALGIGPSSLEFRTTALGTPSGAGAAWRMRVSVQDSSAVLRATSEETGAVLVARMNGVTGLRIRTQSLGASGEWQEAWSSPSPPAVVRIDFVSTSGLMLPLVVATGLHR